MTKLTPELRNYIKQQIDADKRSRLHKISTRDVVHNVVLPEGKEHGTEAAYDYGCTCTPCVIAHNTARLRRREIRSMKIKSGEIQVEHGTLKAYRSGCDCEPCRWAYRDYKREVRARKRAQHEGVVVNE